jgi:RNA polymerase sigma-70 factor (ECF subfamily)
MSEESATPEPDEQQELLDSLDLVRQAQEGELAAYGELFARYYTRVQALVRKRMNPELRGEMESVDLLQEAMLDAIRGFSAFEVRSRPELVGWFARIVENNLRSAARHMHAQKRDRRREVPLEYVSAYMEQSEPHHRPPAEGPDPLELASRKEQRDLLLECFASLDDDHRTVIALRHRQHATWAEIAQKMGRSGPDAARMLYTRARIQLQRAFRQRGGDTQP